jgi:hypothetical protein
MKFREFRKLGWTAVAAALALLVGTVPLAAYGSKPKVKPSTVRAPKTTARPSTSTGGKHAPKSTSRPSTSSSGNHRTPSTTGRSNGGPSTGVKAPSTTGPSTTIKPSTTSANPPSTTMKPSTTSANPPSTTMKPSTIQRPSTTQKRLAKNPSLGTRLQAKLPPSTNVNDAATGFRNLGQFVAAVNVSQNLGIPFDTVKAKMTGPDPVSLGQAIQQLKGLSETTANAMAKTALSAAEREIKSTHR